MKKQQKVRSRVFNILIPSLAHYTASKVLLDEELLKLAGLGQHFCSELTKAPAQSNSCSCLTR
jgi:hypothetical protein